MLILNSPLLSGSRKVLAAIPAVAVALLPKCPACLPGYAALAGSLGLGLPIESAYLLPLMLLVLILIVLGYRSRGDNHRGFAPIVLEAFGTSILIAGRFLLSSRLVSFGGAACLIAGSLWSLWPHRLMTGNACPGHVPAKSGSHG